MIEFEMSEEQEQLSPLEVEHKVVEQFRREVSQLMRELQQLPGRLREAVAALDSEAVANLREREDEIKDALFLAEAHLYRHKLNWLALDREDAKRKKAGLEVARNELADEWRRIQDEAAKIQDDHMRMTTGLLFQENRLKVNREDEIVTSVELSRLIESRVGEVSHE
ncbi:MAG TPA: hypothetical protein VIW80_01695 [Pyrinomonadaceae bacterium]|jgi:hypothetical protein